MALPIVCQARKLRGAAALLLLAGACSRTGLYPGDLEEELPSIEPGSSLAGGGGTSPTAGASGSFTAGTSSVPPASNAGSSAGPTMPAETCHPSAEACNGRDDDCNGVVDDLPPRACAGGGFRFCVAGRFSDCPHRCDVCVPGGVRICENSFCSFWGEQECAADGQGFGKCREAEPPPECAATAKKFKNSKELEQCCLDNGYCCLDEHDLDQDGDRHEMLGACRDIVCQ